MAEELEKTKQYKYQSNANLVIQRLDSGIPRETGPTGESSTLSTFDQTTLRDQMGARSAYGKPKEEIEKAKEKTLRKEKDDTNKSRTPMDTDHTTSVLETDVDTTYKPTCTESKQSYELIIRFIEDKFASQNASIMHSIAHEMISIIKNDKFTASQTKINQLNAQFKLFTTFDKNELSFLQKCCRKINDFGIIGVDPDEKAARENNRVVPIKSFEEEDEEPFFVSMVGDNEDDSGDDRIEPNVEDPNIKKHEEERHKTWNKKLVAQQMRDGDGSGDVEVVELSTKKEVDPKEVDAYWLQRAIKDNFPSKQDEAKETADELLQILEIRDKRKLENKVSDVLGFTNWEFTKKMLRNKDVIVWCTKLKRAKNETERKEIEAVMAANNYLCKILEDLQATYGTTHKKIKRFRENAYKEAQEIRKTQQIQSEQKSSRNEKNVSYDLREWNLKHSNKMKLDLDALTFREGGHFMGASEWKLRNGSTYHNHKGYQEIFVPHIATPPKQTREIAISELPVWAQTAFKHHGDEEEEGEDAASDSEEEMKSKTVKFAVTKLNAVQSACYKTAFLSSENILLSAPTGAGKTNVAMLCILRELGIRLNVDNKTVRNDEFKIVYIAPMKSLVREIVLKFSKRLASYNVRVAELSGDQQLSHQQIAETTIIVTTPEKWDIITRKGMDRSYASLVKLVIIDEIHLLHDLRGCVLESIVMRTIRNIEKTENLIRIIGLSATMPNYIDIASFLRVKYNRGLFVFGASYRPIPLISRFAGITLKKPFKQYELMNNLCYEYVAEQVSNAQQVIVFVHSRKETGNTAKMLLEKFKTDSKLSLVLAADGADREILEQEQGDAENESLRDLLIYGFGIHNAGMSRSDRMLVEDLFKARVLKVLVSTATLAWGVNMPAHCVIIRGTQIYNSQRGKWCELSMLDILQMFGRAGRPDTGDKYGEAYLITTHRELAYYMPLLNDQLPIESQLIQKLPDCLNAEIVLGTISSMKEAVEWLSYSYLNIRMRKSPQTYNVENNADAIQQRLIDLVHSALLKLQKCGLIMYDAVGGGIIGSTDLGRIASYYYVSYLSMFEYSEMLSVNIINDIELFKIFSVSLEFKYISVREGEKSELLKLLDRVAIPMKESVESSSCKINVLLQAYISRLALDGFALKSDMCYIQQSASRLMRALFEICLHRRWAYVAYRCLTICKMILNKQWSIESPLRQFGIQSVNNKLTYSIIRRIEKCEFSFDRFLYLSSAEIGELIGMPAVGKDIYKLIHCVPKLLLCGQIQPLTPSIIKIELIIDIDFEWNDFYHGSSQQFWIIVEDVDGEYILHYEYFILYKKYCQNTHNLSFTIPISNHLQINIPQYFVRIVSDKWLGSTTILPISFRHLILPKKYKQKTHILDLQPLPTHNPHVNIHADSFPFYNPIQTQIFNHLYNTNANILLCGPSFCGKTSMAEIAIMKMLRDYPNGKCLYITTRKELVDKQFVQWSSSKKWVDNVCKLEEDDCNTLTMHKLNKHSIIISLPQTYDKIQRNWRKRKAIQNLNLFILDNLHFIGMNNNEFNGSIYEIVIARQKYIMSALSIPTRIVGLSLSVCNASNVGDWLEVDDKLQFNFVSQQFNRCNIEIDSSDINNFESRHISYIKKCHSFICNNNNNNNNDKSGGSIIFVSSRKECRRLASDLIALSAKSKRNTFLNLPLENFLLYLNKCKNIRKESGLYKCLCYGIGFIHKYTDHQTRSDICKFYKTSAISILICQTSQCYNLELFDLKISTKRITSSVILFGSKYYDFLSHCYANYELCDMNEMMSFCNGAENNNILILCHSNLESYYAKFLVSDCYPIESHLDCLNNLEDCLNAEIISRTVSTADEAIDFMTWTFYYFRLTQNPNYYNLRAISDVDLSQHLSQLIEQSFHRLYNANCISVDENMDVSPLNNGLIASYYYITYTTIEFFYHSLRKLKSSNFKLKNILSILCFATEYENNICLRKNEENTIKKLSKHLPIAINTNSSISETNISVSSKVNVLLQTHFMRLQLKSDDILADRNVILSHLESLLYSMIDILSTLQILSAVLIAIELSQMSVQSMWLNDNYLLQLPYVNKEKAKILSDKYNINNIYDLLEIDDENIRLKAFNEIDINDTNKLNEIANFCNNYPDLELNFEIVSQSNEEITLLVEIESEDIDETILYPKVVNAQRYPFKKYETWFLIVGHPQTNKLMFIKRFTMKRKIQTFNVTFKTETTQKEKYKLYLMSDSYLGCDQYLDIH